MSDIENVARDIANRLTPKHDTNSNDRSHWINEHLRADIEKALSNERRRYHDIALAIDSGRGNEKEIAKAIMKP